VVMVEVDKRVKVGVSRGGRNMWWVATRRHIINRWNKHKGGEQPTCKQSRCERGNDETTSRSRARRSKS
jgi:hypothetical protein